MIHFHFVILVHPGRELHRRGPRWPAHPNADRQEYGRTRPVVI